MIKRRRDLKFEIIQFSFLFVKHFSQRNEAIEFDQELSSASICMLGSSAEEQRAVEEAL